MVDSLPRDLGDMVDVRKTLIIDSNAFDDAEIFRWDPDNCYGVVLDSSHCTATMEPGHSKFVRFGWVTTRYSPIPFMPNDILDYGI